LLTLVSQAFTQPACHQHKRSIAHSLQASLLQLQEVRAAKVQALAVRVRGGVAVEGILACAPCVRKVTMSHVPVSQYY
jgi:hypothetical protein